MRRCVLEDVWNVFIPLDILNDFSMYLTGEIDTSSCSVYVTGTCKHYNCCNDYPIVGKLLASYPSSANSHILSSFNKTLEYLHCDYFVCLGYCITTKQVYCCVRALGCSSFLKCICVLFNPSYIFSSVFIHEHFTNEIKSNKRSHVSRLLTIFNKQKSKLFLNPIFSARIVNLNNPNLIIRILCTFFLKLFVFFFTIKNVLHLVLFKWCHLSSFIQIPSTLKLIVTKTLRFKSIQYSQCQDGIGSWLL